MSSVMIESVPLTKEKIVDIIALLNSAVIPAKSAPDFISLVLSLNRLIEGVDIISTPSCEVD